VVPCQQQCLSVTGRYFKSDRKAKIMPDFYAIQLISKHTGETTWLGLKHKDREAAKQYAEQEVCSKCNRYEMQPFPAGWQWVNRRDGFKPPAA
jgi:hypothetical protein